MIIHDKRFHTLKEISFCLQFDTPFTVFTSSKFIHSYLYRGYPTTEVLYDVAMVSFRVQVLQML